MSFLRCKTYLERVGSLPYVCIALLNGLGRKWTLHAPDHWPEEVIIQLPVSPSFLPGHFSCSWMHFVIGICLKLIGGVHGHASLGLTTMLLEILGR